MDKFFLFWFYIACMLGMVFLITSGLFGSTRTAWRYTRTLLKHIAFLAAAGTVVAFAITSLL
jgi:hypothetical protein